MGFKDFSLCVCVGGAGPKSAICTPTSPDVALPSPSLYPPLCCLLPLMPMLPLLSLSLSTSQGSAVSADVCA